MTSLAETACRRCREQKLKCSRQLPDCARCSRFSAVCTYPNPPNRKALAALRAPPKRRYSANTKSPTAADVRRAPTASVAEIQLDGSTPATRNSASSDIQTQLSLAVQELLQEIYFTCQFHSSLLFHQPTFAQDFKAGNVSQHLLLAMYANSTIFLPPNSSMLSRHAAVLGPLGDLRVLGRQWALQAARTVLQDVDQPTFASVQVCEMLSLYWFSVGDFQRNSMFLSIAYSAACMLSLDSEDGHSCLKNTKSNASAAPEWLRAEMARRCYWAVWYTRCIISDHCLAGIPFNDKMLKLPLPMDEMSFIRAQQAPSETLCATLDKFSSTSNKERRLGNSILAELMVLMLYWAKIRQLVESRTQMPAQELLARVYELEGRLASWRSGLNDQFSYTKRNLYEQPVINQQSLFILIHALYHQCRTVLHSSLVPQFSGLCLPENIPTEVTYASARIALRSAQEISSLGADLLTLDWDPTRVPGFVGYCMYVSASIQIGILGTTDSPTKDSVKISLVSNLEWLGLMKIYWSNSEKFWERIRVLYENQMSRLRAQNGEGAGARPITATQERLKDLDQLASEVRDPGQLPEPLADSVLAYSLRRFRPIGKAQLRAIPELGHVKPFDILTQILEETPGSSQMPSAIPGLFTEERSTVPGADVEERCRASLAVPVSVGVDAWMTTPQIAIPQSPDWSWWDMNTDNFQSLDHLLSLDGAGCAPAFSWEDTGGEMVQPALPPASPAILAELTRG